MRSEPPNRKGYMKLRRGLPELEGDKPTSDVQWNYERLIARVNPNRAWVLVYVLDRTQSGYAGPGLPPPEYTKIDPVAVADFLNVSPRHVRGIIQGLIKLEALASRCPQDPWSLKALPENFDKLPVLGATNRPGRPSKPRHGAVPAPAPIAAYCHTPASTSTNTGNDAPIAAAPRGEEQTKIPEMDFPNIRRVFAVPTGESHLNKREVHFQSYIEARNAALTEAASVAERLAHPDVRDAILQLVERTSEEQARTEEVQFGAPVDGHVKSISTREKSMTEPEKSGSAPAAVDFRDPEVHCPLNFGCPYLANDLADDKPIAFTRLTSQPADRLAGPTLEEVKAHLLSYEVLQWFQDMPTERIWQETHTNLQGAPLDDLKRRINIRGPHLHSMGAIPALAREVGDRWKAGESTRIEAECLWRSREFHRLRDTVLYHRDQLQVAWEKLQEFVG